MIKGDVLKSTGKEYLVKTDENEVLICGIRGKMRLIDNRATNPIAAGDVVFVDKTAEGQGQIVKIEERRNYLIRKSTNLSKAHHIVAANIDQVIIVVTIAFPETPVRFIDRLLVASEAYKIPSVIVFNKVDLLDSKQIELAEYYAIMYKEIGYPSMFTSTKTNVNIDQFHALLKDKKSVLTGNSGVGKSTLINTLDSSLTQRTSAISSSHNKGKHTTTFAEMIELPIGGYIIDTPGIKSFGMIDMKKEEISHYFPEIFKVAENCKFYNCSHTHEPNCAVKEGVAKGDIWDSRYQSYLSLLENDDDKYR